MRSKILFAIFALGVLAFALIPQFIESPYALHILILFFMNAALGQSWNIVGGYAGQYSLGHAAFYGFGAYTSLILLTRFNIPPWFGVWGGVALGVVVALVVGSICFRLRGPYFVLASIAVAEIFLIAATNLDSVTNGGQGILATEMPPLKLGSWLISDFSTKTPYYYMGLGLALVTLGVSYWVSSTKIGYQLQAIREDQDAAESLGIHLAYNKNRALALSAAFTALTGGFAGLYVGFVDPPTALSIDISISIVLVVIIGGIGTLFGPLIGAVVVVALSEILRSNLIAQWLFESGLAVPESGFGKFLNDQLAHAHVLIYGVMVVVVILFMPQGVLGFARKILHRRAQAAKGGA
jgi:branched-chain amino acid transport system permease protein